MELIILAGGLGTRLRLAVPDLPKPMAPVRGRPLLSYLLDHWVSQGLSHIILSVGYLGKMIQDFYGESYLGVPISYSVETSPLGTGGALLQSTQYLNSSKDFFMTNGDTLTNLKASELYRAGLLASADLVVGMIHQARNDRYGAIVTRDGLISEFDVSCPVNAWVNAGTIWFSDIKVLSGLSDAHGVSFSLEKEGFQFLLKKHMRMVGAETSAQFIDIGVPESYAQCAQWLLQEH